MNAMPALAPIPRRNRTRPLNTAPAMPRRVAAMVEVTVFDADAHARGEHPFKRVECEVMVRAASPAVAGLPLHLREAVEAYAMAVEQVEAGGATDPEAVTRSGAGSAAKEGRQFHAVKQVDFWRRLDRAISGGRVTLGAKSISHRDLMRAVAIDGLSVAQLVAAMGFARSNARQFKLLAGVVAAATAMAVELGMMEAPEPAKQEPKPKKAIIVQKTR